MIELLDKLIQDGVDRGLLQKSTSSDFLDSSQVEIEQESYINFGSCSYMGLEYDDRLKDAVKDTVDRFGTQFSTSRTYLSIGLYDELEAELSKMFSKPLIASASTTLGHLATLPIVVEEGDAVILDLQVHSSVQMATQLLKAKKIPIHLIPHNRMDSLEVKIKALQGKAKRIWYLADGVYSMYGDFAPLDELQQLMDKYDQLYLYIDDAHGMGWTGKNGVGYVRSQMAHHDKMILTTSLNKSFASSGGVVVFPNEEMYRKVKNCGTTLIFSGPIQPPMLGAGIASAKLHQTVEFAEKQDELKEKIAFTNRRLKELGLPQYMVTDSPLFFIPVGLPRVILRIIKRMKKKGFFLNSAGFPATPMKKGGLRFMINQNLSFEEIDDMLVTLRTEYLLGVFEEKSSPAEIAKEFRLEPFLVDHGLDLASAKDVFEFQEEHFDSIQAIDAHEWDAIFAKEGTNAHHNLKELEQIFRNHPEEENNWRVNYHVIRDKQGEIILASVYSLVLMMDDLLADRATSEKIKELRQSDKYYLTSKTLISGTPFTKGKSVYVNYAHNDWKEAVTAHVEMLQDLAEREEASKLVLRDFGRDQRDRLESFMLELGLVDIRLPNNCVVRDMDWEDENGLAQRMSQKYRYSLRKEILKKESQFRVEYKKPESEELRRYTYELYQQVYARSVDIAVFELPYVLFERMFADDNYDFIYLYLEDGPAEPVAVLISQVVGKNYNAELVGLDYDFVKEKGTYKQILYQAVKRAKQLGCATVDMAYTAEMEKKKVGAVPEESYAFSMALEHYSFAEMELLV